LKRRSGLNYYKSIYNLFKNVAGLNYSFQHIKKTCEVGYGPGLFILSCNSCDQGFVQNKLHFG